MSPTLKYTVQDFTIVEWKVPNMDESPIAVVESKVT